MSTERTIKEQFMLSALEKLTNNCSCGNKHSLVTKVIYSGKDAFDKLVDFIKNEYGKGALVICDENTKEYALPIMNSLGSDMFVLSGTAHANEIETAKLFAYIDGLDVVPSVMVACGSGSLHDITRFCAYEKSVPFVSYPTAASVDGFVSGVAAMTMYGQKLTYLSAAPVALFADPDVYSKAPRRLTASGVGDVIGKVTALFDWKAANILIGEHLCPEIYNLMSDALNAVIDAAKNESVTSVLFAEKVMNGLILSGVAMQLQGNSRPASGAEHHMSHLWEMHVINEETDALHGEKVGVGTLFVLEQYSSARYKLNSTLDIDLQRIFDNDNVTRVFGGLTAGILEENLPNGAMISSVLGKLSKESISENTEILSRLIDELPSASEIKELLSNCGAPVLLSELGLPDNEDFIKESLLYSPFVRNRLTFAKVLSAIELSAR